MALIVMRSAVPFLSVCPEFREHNMFRRHMHHDTLISLRHRSLYSIVIFSDSYILGWNIFFLIIVFFVLLNTTHTALEV